MTWVAHYVRRRVHEGILRKSQQSAAEHVSGANRKLSERDRSGERACEKNDGRERSQKQERHGTGTHNAADERTKLAAQISPKGDMQP